MHAETVCATGDQVFLCLRQMILKRTNQLFRSRIKKVTSRFERFNKYFNKVSNQNKTQIDPQPISTNQRKCSAPPSARSSAISARITEKSCDKFINNIKQSFVGSYDDRINPAVREYLYSSPTNENKFRMRSFSECRSKSNIESDFPSLHLKNFISFGSQRSINSIFRMHDTLANRHCNKNNKSYSDSSIYPDKHVAIKQSNKTVQLAQRPTSLHISSKYCKTNPIFPHPYFYPAGVLNQSNSMKSNKPMTNNKFMVSEMTLDQYIQGQQTNYPLKSTTTPLKSTITRNKKTVKALDDCIDLLINLSI